MSSLGLKTKVSIFLALFVPYDLHIWSNYNIRMFSSIKIILEKKYSSVIVRIVFVFFLGYLFLIKLYNF